MSVQIIRDEIEGINGTKAGIEITIPDQTAVQVFRDENITLVQSTSTPNKRYSVTIKRGRPVSCTCKYHQKNKRRWAQSPCVHVRAAQANLSVRGIQARAYCLEIAAAAREIGVSEKTFKAQIWGLLQVCSIWRYPGVKEQDLWGAVARFEFDTYRDWVKQLA
jgi:hypothetical protein